VQRPAYERQTVTKGKKTHKSKWEEIMVNRKIPIHKKKKKSVGPPEEEGGC